MIRLTRLDGGPIYINEDNVQWIENLPDTAITFLGGARLIVRESVEVIMSLIDPAHSGRTSLDDILPSTRGTGTDGPQPGAEI